jgi:1-deoxy-D-xylulose-5-phosphate synthase
VTPEEPYDLTLDALRALPVAQLPAACARVRRFLLDQTQEKAGHMASSLGATELTLALHHVLRTPEDILIWDVGHQAYVHKIITDRAALFHTQRKPGGLSGFPKRSESPFDAFGVGHASTALSAAVGFWRADAAAGRIRHRVAVVGDGALTGGLVFEALNDGAAASANVLLVFNDNGLSIEGTVGALAQGGAAAYKRFFASLGWTYLDATGAAPGHGEPSGAAPGRAALSVSEADGAAPYSDRSSDANPVDGNNCEALVAALRHALTLEGPRVLHVRTHRPDPAEWGAPEKPVSEEAFQFHFAEAVLEAARQDSRVQVVTPAMAPGASVDRFRAEFPDRTVDVGIAEQHALTTAAGMAAAGGKPVVSMYSTFFQRAVDAWIHDVALQNLPVVLCLDRAGWVGEDGPTHHGMFDLALLRSVPNTAVYAPRNGSSLRRMLHGALAAGTPTVLRYPRGRSRPDDGLLEDAEGMVLLSAGRGAREETPPPTTGFASTLHWVAGPLGYAVAENHPSATVWSVGRVHPLPEAALRAAAGAFLGLADRPLTAPSAAPEWHVWEDAQSIGGLFEGVAAWVAQHAPGIRVISHGYPNAFMEHGSEAPSLDQ